jgi:hypothetical protein
MIHRLLTPHFFVWFVQWIELIHHHLILYSYLVNTNMRNKVIPPNLRNELMMHHHILAEVISQTKHPLVHRALHGCDVCRHPSGIYCAVSHENHDTSRR